MAPPGPGACCMLRRTEGGVMRMEARVSESRLAAWMYMYIGTCVFTFSYNVYD